MTSQWYNKVTMDPNDLSPLPEAVEYFEKQHEQARKELNVTGSLTKQAAELPGITAHRYNQLQELEAILQYLNLKFTKTRSSVFKRYLEVYNRSLTSRDADRYCDADPEVHELAVLINQVALVRNKFLGIFKGLETKNWQISNITKLKVAGFDDSQVDGSSH